MEQAIQGWIDENYEALYKRLKLIALHLTGDIDLAEDMVQDVFVLALLHSEKLFNHPNREGWLIVSLHNMIKNEERRMRQQEISLEESMEPYVENEFYRLNEMLPKDLAEQDRKILIWYYEKGWEYKDIASCLGISEGACRVRVFRAKERCAALWKAMNKE